MHGDCGGTRVCSGHVKSAMPTRHPRGDVNFAMGYRAPDYRAEPKI